MSNATETPDAADAADAPGLDVDETRGVREENVLRVRLGHGANCSSVGSVVDTLFLGATLGGVVFAAICAAMKVEGVTVVGTNRGREGERDGERGRKGGRAPDGEGP